VQAVLAARIDRLPEREKEVLQTAAVIGKTFGEALLREVAASTTTIGEAELDAALSALVAAEFFYEASLYPRLEYSFKHPLTQEVAQGSQLRERRARVHAAVARSLEAQKGDVDENAAEIAHHWDEAGDAGRAARWHRRAAEWAGRSDPRESLRHWRRVRELAHGVEDERERTTLALEACQKLLSIGWRMGGSESEFSEIFQEGRGLAERSLDRAALARLLGTHASVRVQQTGSGLEFVRNLEEAERIASECDDRALSAALGSLMAFAHQLTGDCNRALEWSARVREEVGSDHELGRGIFGFSPRGAAHSSRGFSLLYLGRLEEAQLHIRDAEREAEAAGDLEVLTWIHSQPALLARARGSAGSAVEFSRRGVELAEKLATESSRVSAYHALATALLIDGQAAAALELFEQSGVIAIGRSSNRTYLSQLLVALAETEQALGRTADALASAREAIDVAFEGGFRFFEGEAQLALASALLASDVVAHRAEIESALDRARELAESTGCRLLSPRIVERRARLAAALGDANSSDRALREALELYRSIGATGHAARLSAELVS
jgi:adenylate cyclase